jgi:RHS repeat-associated protein
VDALGRSTRFFYNERGQFTNTVFADGTGTSLAYDAAGRRTHSTDRAGRITQFYYDAVGRLTNTIFPDLTSTSTEYDLAGRVITQIDPRGNRTEFRYEETCCAATIVRNALGKETRSINDAAGRKITEIDPLGRITRFAYDELGRRTNTFLADGTSRRTVYDVLGRVIAEVDQAGVTNRFEYDMLGRLTNVVDALGHSTSYSYNEAGNLLTQRDALGRVTRYEYDSLGRRIATILPLGQRATNVFNAAGNLVAATDFNTNTIRFDYDENNRLRAKRFPDGTAVTYGYTLTGRRSAITNALGVFRFAYDSRDRLLARTNWDGRIISYTYDPAGNVTSVTTPSQVVSNTHDALNRLLTVAEGANSPATYTYDDANNVVLMTLPNGTFRTNTYDALNRVTNIAHHGPGGVFASFGYTLGPTGQRLGVRELSTFNAQLSTVQRRWSYDPLQRLTREELSGDLNLTNDYVMDAVGNRLYRTNTLEGVTAYAYDPNDQLLTETLWSAGLQPAAITTYSYDANGNTTARSNATESVSYTWNAENRLVAAGIMSLLTSAATNLQYAYDDDGIRIASSVDGAETRYLIDANRAYAQVMEEYTSGGAVNAAYVYGQHPPISQNRAGIRSFFHGDHLNSTRSLTGSGASPTDRYHFDAYGRTLVQSGSTENPYLYTGEHRDRNLGLDYLRARYLNFSAGRFYGRDVLSGSRIRPSSQHRFLYGIANPINHRDPSGRITLVETMTTAQVMSIIYTAHARANLTALRDTLLLTKNYLRPSAQLQEMGLKLIASGVPSGFGFYERGRHLASQGFKQLSDVLERAYKDQGEALKRMSGLLKQVKSDVEAGQNEEAESLRDRRDHAVEVLEEFANWTDALGFTFELGGQAVPADKLNDVTIFTRSLTEVLSETTDDELRFIENVLKDGFEALNQAGQTGGTP